MKVILLADNDPILLRTRAEFLRNHGYTMLTASSPEEARGILDRQHVHLAVLDIRLCDDSPGDISGLELAQDPRYAPVPKVMLTMFASVDAVKQALMHSPDELPPAVDFVSKKDGLEAMLDAVNHAFEHHVCLNWDLQISPDPQQRLSVPHLANLVQPGLPYESQGERAAELEDLFRKLFCDYRLVRLDRLFWHHGGQFCLRILAQCPEEATDGRLLVCGEREPLKWNLRRLEKLAPTSVQGLRLAGEAETMHFAAACYALPDVELETVQCLRDLFETGKERPLRAAVDHLLKEALQSWHQRGQRVEGEELMVLYRRWAGLGEDGPGRAVVEDRVEVLLQASRTLSSVQIERRDGSIVFGFPNEAPLVCPDPVVQAYTPLIQGREPVVCRVSPGWLTADNILVDERQGVWLTDFACAGQAPQWWDFVSLEAVFRFDLSQAPDLLAWHELEQCLVAPLQLHDDLGRDVIADLKTTVAAIEAIRRQAGSETGPDALPYYAGLLVWTVAAMARYTAATLYTHGEQMRGAHLLLAGAMIAHRLQEILRLRNAAALQPGASAGPPADNVLRLAADNVQVQIGLERKVVPGGQELKLFRCLHDSAGQVVTRQTLVEQVFGEAYIRGDKYQEGRLNSLVRRLRERIEANPDKPRYILTARGQGYRLEAGETPST